MSKMLLCNGRKMSQVFGTKKWESYIISVRCLVEEYYFFVVLDRTYLEIFLPFWYNIFQNGMENDDTGF